MNEDQLKEHALEMLSGLESWIKHSDAYQDRLFSNYDDINDKTALEAVAWVKKQISATDRIAPRPIENSASELENRLDALYLANIIPTKADMLAQQILDLIERAHEWSPLVEGIKVLCGKQTTREERTVSVVPDMPVLPGDEL